MFEKFNFTKQQVKNYWDKSVRDLVLARQGRELEIMFVFSYEALLKLAITVCAYNNLRVKARRGHHIELINKLAEILKDEEISQIGQGMRMKRNSGLYRAGDTVSRKEADSYLEFIEQIFKKADSYIFPQKLL